MVAGGAGRAGPQCPPCHVLPRRLCRPRHAVCPCTERHTLARAFDPRRSLGSLGRLMRFPVHIATDMIAWQLRNWWRGNTRYPSVLMLEPLHTCNLACLGCSPERYSGDLKDRLSLEQCLEAVDDAGAPV